MIETEQFGIQLRWKVKFLWFFFFPFIKEYNILFLICYYVLVFSRDEGKNAEIQTRSVWMQFVHISHFLSNISEHIQFWLAGFLAGHFQELYTGGYIKKKQEKYQQVLQRPLKHKAVTEPRISHEFSSMLSDIS